MKVMVVYNSMYGNTEQVARAIGEALGSPAEVGVYRVGEVRPESSPGLTCWWPARRHSASTPRLPSAACWTACRPAR